MDRERERVREREHTFTLFQVQCILFIISAVSHRNDNANISGASSDRLPGVSMRNVCPEYCK